MATIVPMPAPRTRSYRSADTQDGATILFFTGVRYVRDEDPDGDDTDEAPNGASYAEEQDTPALALI